MSDCHQGWLPEASLHCASMCLCHCSTTPRINWALSGQTVCCLISSRLCVTSCILTSLLPFYQVASSSLRYLMAIQNHLLSNTVLIRPDDNDDSDNSLQGETMKVQVNTPFKYPYCCLSMWSPYVRPSLLFLSLSLSLSLSIWAASIAAAMEQGNVQSRHSIATPFSIFNSKPFFLSAFIYRCLFSYPQAHSIAATVHFLGIHVVVFPVVSK